MNRCEFDISLIHRLAENELGAEQAEAVKRHMSSCAHCRARFEEFVRMNEALRNCLVANTEYEDTADLIVRRTKSLKPSNARAFRLKRILAVAAVCVVCLALSGYLLTRVYFRKTFSYQVSGMVVRCSAGIQKMAAGEDWQSLRAGQRIGEGIAVRTPESGSFLAFDSIRIWSERAAEFESLGNRALKIREGELYIASGRRRTPVTIELGGARVISNGAVFNISRHGDRGRMGVAAGEVDLVLPDGERLRLAANQEVKFEDEGGVFNLAEAHVGNPFLRLKVSVIDRIRQRFAKVMARYRPDWMQWVRPSNGSPFSPGMWRRPEEMLQFVSYHPVRQALSANTVGDYYESLFVPSNRSLSMGKQRTIPVGWDNAVSFPAWSHDGSMIAYIEQHDKANWWPAVVKVARLDDLAHPWVISQQYEAVMPCFPLAWAPDNRHVLFMAAESFTPDNEKWWDPQYKIKIAPIDPAEGLVRAFDSPFRDLPIKLPLPVGGTISPQIVKLPWGDALLCANWGNIGYIPVEEDGQSIWNDPGLFLTNFNPRELFVAGAVWSPSGSKIIFMAVEDLKVNPVNVYILYDVEDILDGFAPPPRSLKDPRIRKVAPINAAQFSGGFSFDESLAFFEEDVNNAWRSEVPIDFSQTDFDLFYANALPDYESKPTQIQLPGSQVFLTPSPEGNRIAYCNIEEGRYELRVVSFEIEADIDVDLGGVLIDNSGTNLIVPPGTLPDNFAIRISTPFSLTEKAEHEHGETRFFALRLIDAKGLENPKFIEPMTLTIRYTDDEVAGLDEEQLQIYHYDESDPSHGGWVSLGGEVDTVNNEITVEIRHFSMFSVGGSVTR
ncbi:MAG: hypothetical protein Kow0099_08860 [Candidatus Abyssubacteria bacterium]